MAGFRPAKAGAPPRSDCLVAGSEMLFDGHFPTGGLGSTAQCGPCAKSTAVVSRRAGFRCRTRSAALLAACLLA